MGLLSTLGGLVGLAVGGPLGAALGSGIGTLASGGDIGDALRNGLLGFGIGSIPGVAGGLGQMAGAAGLQGTASSLAMQAANPNALGKMAQGGLGGFFGGGGGAGGGIQQVAAAPAAASGGGLAQGLGSLASLMDNPLIMAGMMQMGSPKNVELMTDEQRRQAATGERLPDYQGTAVPQSYSPIPRTPVPVPSIQRQPSGYARGGPVRVQRRYAAGGPVDMPPAGMGRPAQMPPATGGLVRGPGTGKSDSIPATITQGGRPVEQARLSDNEFVMTEPAVRGAGNGNRAKGAARMYQMMREFEKRA